MSVHMVTNRIIDKPEQFGLNPSDGEMYGVHFLGNTKQTPDGDPVPHRVNEKNFTKIIKSFEGRPWLIPPRDESTGSWYPYHIRKDGTLQDLLENQKPYAAGEIVKTYINEKTGNANAIVKYFPKYHDQILAGDIPEYDSWFMQILKGEPDDIEDALGIHLQAVPKPGYEPELASIRGVCAAGLDECMNELKLVGASAHSAQPESFSKAKNEKPQSIMSMQQQQQKPEITFDEEGFNKLVEMVQAIGEQVQTISSKMGESEGNPDEGKPQVGAAATVTTEESTQTPNQGDLTPEQKQLQEMKTELESIKKERQADQEKVLAREESLNQQERALMAEKIADLKILLHRLDISKRDDEVKRLMELKDKEDKSIDLSPLLEELNNEKKQFVGASGNSSVYFNWPELDSNESDSDPFTKMEEMSNL